MLVLYLNMADTEQHSVAIEKIYHRYRGLMRGVALKVLQNETLAEDAVHEAMLVLIEWSRTHREEDPEKLAGLIVLIVRQRALRLLQQQKRTVSVEELKGFEPVYTTDEMQEHGPMLSALGRLRPEQREILVLRYLHELPLSEVAKTLNIRLSTAQKRLHRARQAIKKEVEEHPDEY